MTGTDDYEILPGYPSPQDHTKLRGKSGLSTPPETCDVAKAIANSVHGIVARSHSGETVGMVRLIGDGCLFMQLCDMAVLPEHQGHGLGKRLLDEMCKWLDENAPAAYVSLIGDAPGQKLYRSRGFVETSGIGMKRSNWGK